MRPVLRGIATVRRLGVGTFLCLAVGWYLLFTSLGVFSSVAAEKKLPCPLSATGERVTDELVLTVRELDGVLASSKATQEGMTVVTESETRVTGTLVAVSADVLDGELLTGSKYDDGTVMPYLLLNEKCLSRFFDKNERLVRTDAETLTGASVTLNGFPACVAGILRDGLEEPRGYICCTAHETMLLTQGQIPAYTTLWLRLESYGSQETVLPALAVLGLSPAGGTAQAQLEAWAQSLERARLIVLCACFLLFAGGLQAAAKTRLDRVLYTREYLFYRYCGASRIQLCLLFTARIAAAALLSLCLAAVVFWINGLVT